jgi:hypothetical protein
MDCSWGSRPGTDVLLLLGIIAIALLFLSAAWAIVRGRFQDDDHGTTTSGIGNERMLVIGA